MCTTKFALKAATKIARKWPVKMGPLKDLSVAINTSKCSLFALE